MSMSTPQLRDGDTVRKRLVRAYSLLEEALQLIDENADAPEIGAGLEELMREFRTLIT